MGWHEAFVAVDTDDPEGFAREIAAGIRAATQLDATVGIGQNKLQAKLATGFGKPAGVFRLTHETWFDVLGERPTDALWGIGAKTARKLAALGIETVRDLALADPGGASRRVRPGELEAVAGPAGPRPGSLAGDQRPVRAPVPGPGESTFQADLDDWDQVRAEVARLAERVTADVVAEERPAVRVVVKVRYAPFFTSSHSRSLPLAGADGRRGRHPGRRRWPRWRSSPTGGRSGCWGSGPRIRRRRLTPRAGARVSAPPGTLGRQDDLRDVVPAQPQLAGDLVGAQALLVVQHRQ